MFEWLNRLREIEDIIEKWDVEFINRGDKRVKRTLVNLVRSKRYGQSYLINSYICSSVNYIYGKVTDSVKEMKKEIGESISVLLKRIKKSRTIIDLSFKKKQSFQNEKEITLISATNVQEGIWNL